MIAKLKRAVRRTLEPLTVPTWRLCVRWPLLADIYYVFDGSFRREHRAVLLGKLKHLKDMASATDKGAAYTLRRNTHRLEKGLIMRPRRPVFAADYIGETVSVYCGLRTGDDTVDAQLMCWAYDVLSEYFRVVASDPRIDPFREQFDQTAPPTRPCETQRRPYQRDRDPLGISPDDMYKLAYRRRSVRHYLPKPVPREVIDRAIEVAGLSPSACNRQPFSFRVFDDPELAPQIGAIPMGTKGFSEGFPCTIVIVGDLRAYFSERDRHVIYVDAGLAAMALQFALEVQGVSSCCINWPDIEPRERRISEAIGLDYNERPVMCMSLGYADPEGEVPFSQKKPLDELRSFNKTC